MASAHYSSQAEANPGTTKDVCGAWRELGQTMVQAALHSVNLTPEDGAALHAILLAGLEELKGEPSDAAVRKQGQTLSAEIERHNQVTQKAVSQAMTEMREMIAALSKGLATIAAQSEHDPHIESLQAVIGSANAPGEMEARRAELTRLVELIATGERERTQRNGQLVQTLQTRIEQLEGSKSNSIATSAPMLDSLTGIPNGNAAREAIVNAQQADRPPLVSVMHIQSLDVLNARFGQRIGDQIVLTCCQHLASNLCRETDRIFRWRGPAFVALLDRDDSPAGVGREVAHVCNAIASSFFGEPHRSILIPVKMSSTTIPLESRLVTDIFDSIERFIVRSGRPTG